MDAGAAGAVVGALEGHESHAGVQKQGKWAIQSLGKDSAARECQVREAGGAAHL